MATVFRISRHQDQLTAKADSLTSWVLACHRDPVISARGGRVRAIRMASATIRASSSAHRSCS